MAVLLRFRPSVRTERLALPDGSVRRVKVVTNDAGTTQHVHDWDDRIHGTARPPAIAIKVNMPSRQRRGMLLRNLGMPKMRQAFQQERAGIWAPVPGSEQLR